MKENVNFKDDALGWRWIMNKEVPARNCPEFRSVFHDKKVI